MNRSPIWAMALVAASLGHGCYEPSDAYENAECIDGDSNKPLCPSGYVCGDEFRCVKQCSDVSHCAAEFDAGDCSACIAGTCRRTDCYLPACGNDILDDDEVCDDGNNEGFDYCSEDCQTVTGRCGDDIIQDHEICDDGNARHGDYCQYDCMEITGWCGDNGVQTNEVCDDGNTADGDYCTPDCQLNTGRCGDSILQANEGCDDGLAPAAGDGCSVDCSMELGFSCTNLPSLCTSTCGDGEQAIDESCDDANLINDDGCSSDCTLEPGFMCAGLDPTVCTFDCGDGVIVTGESCDDGDHDDTNWCNNDCQPQLVCEPDAPCWPLLSTGTHSCYEDIYALPMCPGTAGSPECHDTAYCGQDYQYCFGVEPGFVIEGDGFETVAFDARTGVSWQRNWIAIGPAGDDVCKSGTKCRYPEAVEYCGALVYGGYNDWRLPTQPELLSIIDFGRFYPAVDADMFPGVVILEGREPSMWSSTKSFAFPDLLDSGYTGFWGVLMSSGRPNDWIDLDDGDGTVMCARADPKTIVDLPSSERFAQQTVQGDAVFYDRRTQRTWSLAASFQGTWPECLSYCEGLEHAGHDDWRLPNARELHSLKIYKHERDQPTASHPSAIAGDFWSSTNFTSEREYQGAPSTAAAWHVEFKFGLLVPGRKSTIRGARCVRDGPGMPQ